LPKNLFSVIKEAGVLIMDKKNIESKLKELEVEDYIINDDGTVDVNSSVDISFMNLNQIPVQFGRVRGDFNCSNNQLHSLQGSPQSVGFSFFCHKNRLTSLKGASQWVGKSFICSHNELTSLEGAPLKLNGSFDCSENELTSLKGAPKSINGDFDCTHNRLKTLEGIPDFVRNVLYCHGNQIPYHLLMDYKANFPFMIIGDEDL
jgi:hypothetical protein